MKNNTELPLRIGVGVILLNSQKKVFVGKRIDNPSNHWQMPQGGVDENENFLEAAKRELMEDTSIKSVKLIKEIDGWLTYNLPKNLLGKIWSGKYGGQKQKWFIMEFLGKEEEMNIKTNKPEFLDWRWIETSKLPEIAVQFKAEMYKLITKELSSLKLT